MMAGVNLHRPPSETPREDGARHSAFEDASGVRPRLRSIAPKRDAADRILGSHPEIRKVREQLRRVAIYHNVPVLVLGETGTGKELVANAVHELGNRAKAPLVSVNCAALPESLFESELFGHESGAFTGAQRARVGLLEDAAAGTVFLDEIGEMPLASQSKLLRALEARIFRRIGSNRTIELRARIVSATNRTLRKLKRSSLRPDLFYRLAGFTIVLPPLRERIEDISVLADHFLEEFLARHARGPSGVSEAALDVLRAHPWPGNVRELRGVIEHAAILTRSERLGPAEVREAIAARPRLETLSSHPPPTTKADIPKGPAPLPASRLRDVEREMITAAFQQCGGNVSKAARKLGIPRSTLRDRLKRYGLS
jgi:DNA-binding NtrC family response regulator